MSAAMGGLSSAQDGSLSSSIVVALIRKNGGSLDSRTIG